MYVSVLSGFFGGNRQLLCPSHMRTMSLHGETPQTTLTYQPQRTSTWRKTCFSRAISRDSNKS